MYAVVETGGKQYRVEVGTELEVELLDAEPGQAITLDRVLLVADGNEASIGRPLVPNAAVDAEVVRTDRGEKIISFKYRPKARRRVKKGHRQALTILRITDVRLDGRSAAETARKVEADAASDRERLEEAAARQAAADAALAARLAVKADAEAPAQRRKASRAKAGTDEPAGDTAAAPDGPEEARGDPSKPKARGGQAKATSSEAASDTTAADVADTTPADATTEAASTDETAGAGDGDRPEKSE